MITAFNFFMEFTNFGASSTWKNVSIYTCYENIIVLMNIKASSDTKETDWDYFLGVAHQGHNHFRDAIVNYKKSLEKEPHSLTCENIAECYGELGDYTRAHQYIDMAIAMDSTRNDLYREKADGCF